MFSLSFQPSTFTSWCVYVFTVQWEPNKSRLVFVCRTAAQHCKTRLKIKQEMKTKTDATWEEQRCALRGFEGHLMSYPEAARAEWSWSNPITFCCPIITLPLVKMKILNSYCSSVLTAICLLFSLFYKTSYTYSKCKKMTY